MPERKGGPSAARVGRWLSVLGPDQDGIPNDVDKCPDQPETYNGIDDEDGCPDEGRFEMDIKTGRIKLSDKVFFARGSANIDRKASVLLGDITTLLKQRKDIQLIEIQGHADATGTTEVNVRLTQERADAVRHALIDRGIDPRRMTAVGVGSYCPANASTTDEAFDQNRRVEFRVPRTDKGPVKGDTLCKEATAAGLRGTDTAAAGAIDAMEEENDKAPKEKEVRAAVAQADTSLLFPDYHGCFDGEPQVSRVAVLATTKKQTFWLVRIEALVSSQARIVPGTCFAKTADRETWNKLYVTTMTLNVYLVRTKTGLKVVIP